MKITRRSILTTGLAVPALGLGQAASTPRARVAAPVHDSSFDPWVEVNRTNLQHNVTEISRRVGSRPILAVIKNNGYGLGVVNAGRALESFSAIDGLAVVKLHEAMSLRDAGVRKPILLMGPYDERNLADLIARDIMPMVYTPLGAALDRIAAARQKPTPLHVCIDTGIGRVGVPFRQASPLVRDLAGRTSVRIAGVMMTFTEDPEFDVEQLSRFRSLCESLEHDGVTLGRKHAASSFGLFQRPDAFLDMVRPGMALYGVYSEPEFRRAGTLELRPAVSLKAKVAYVKQLPKGDSAGYNRVYIAKEPVWVATLPVGHTDGLPREAAQGARVRINGALYPIVATVSASHCIVEVGPEQRVKIGDEATIFDWQEGSRPEDVNEACKTSVYDLTMHLNPLLPRRVVS
jgi:alanine racemase